MDGRSVLRGRELVHCRVDHDTGIAALGHLTGDRHGVLLATVQDQSLGRELVQAGVKGVRRGLGPEDLVAGGVRDLKVAHRGVEPLHLFGQEGDIDGADLHG